MKTKIFSLILCIGLLGSMGCKDSEIAQFRALGMRHSITLYSANGNIIKHWISTGNVSNENQSDGWYFEDEETHRLVEVTGTLVIEVMP